LSNQIPETTGNPGVTDSQTEQYSPLAALKSSGWLAGKVEGAKLLMPKVMAVLAPFYGVPPTPDSTVYKAMPFLIVIGLHLVHDWSRLKAKYAKWL